MKDPFYKKWWFILFLVVIFLFVLTLLTQDRETNLVTEFNRSMENIIEKKEDKKEKLKKSEDNKNEDIDNKSSDLESDDDKDNIEEDEVGVKSEIIKDPRIYELRDRIKYIVGKSDQIKILDISVVHNRLLDSGNTYISIVDLELLDSINSKKFISDFVMDFIIELSDAEDLVDIKLIWNYSGEILDTIEIDRIDGILGIK